MTKFLEDENNPIIQIFAEFATFLYLVEFDSKGNKMLHNIMLESKKIHIRSLCDFFTDKRSHNDNYIYKDFISSDVDLKITISKEMRDFINKSTAHISKKRGSLEIEKDEFMRMIRELIKTINLFMAELDKSVNNEYREYLENETAQKQRKDIIASIIRIVISNGQKGIEIL